MSDEELTDIVNAHFGVCPACGSREISARDYDGGRVLSCDVECDVCSAGWTEHYRFEGASGFERGNI